VNHWLHALRPHGVDELVRIVAGVTDECFAASMLKKLGGSDHFVPLPGRDRDVDGAGFRIDDGVKFG
jgi:hypothetical protein